MKKKHQKTLELIFARPVNGSIPWQDIEALFVELGGARRLTDWGAVI